MLAKWKVVGVALPAFSPSFSSSTAAESDVAASRAEMNEEDSVSSPQAILAASLSPSAARAVGAHKKEGEKTLSTTPGATGALQDVSSPSSDSYKFAAQQKKSLLGFFDRRRRAEDTLSSAGTKQEMSAHASPCPVASESGAAVSDATLPTSTAAVFATRSTAMHGSEPAKDDLFSWLAIPGLYMEADTVIEHHAVHMGLAKEGEIKAEQFEPVAGEGGKGDAGAANVTATPMQPVHVHRLRPTQFFMPTLCEVCRRAVLDTKVWPPPSPAAQATSSTPSFFSKLLRSPTTKAVETPKVATRQQDDAVTQPMGSPASPSATQGTPPAAAVASPVQQPFLGFGSEGYHCEVCDLALHLQCLRKLRESQACEVLAPAAHHMPEDTADSKATPGGAAEASSHKGDGSSSSSSSSISSFTWDSVKALLGSYLDPNGGSNSRKDANVKFVLSGVFALLDTVASRYPNLTPLTFVKRRQAIQDLSEAHQTLYAACTGSLQDTGLLESITWDAIQQKEQQRTAGRPDQSRQRVEGGKVGGEDEGDGVEKLIPQLSSVPILTREMRPLKMNTSLFSQLTSSFSGTAINTTNKDGSSSLSSSAKAKINNFLPEFARLSTAEVAGPDASFPVQLLLWRALRYATAVYGEVYRRGCLSSTMSAALLFTVNRSSVNVAKEANDLAVTTMLELPPSALRLSRWAAKTTEPSYVLLVDHGVGYIVVSFRGTLNTFDIMTDLAAVGVPFCGGYAHQGAAHVVNALFENRASQYARRPPAAAAAASAAAFSAGSSAGPASTQAGVEVTMEKDSTGKAKVVLEPYALQTLETPDGLLDGVEELAAQHPTYTILITGHSLGGGVAVLLATRLHHDRTFPDSVLRRLHVVVFAPMPTLSLPAASCFDAASCVPRDGGFSALVTSPPTPPSSAASPPAATAEPTDGVRQACFPVWNVVSGFDCVPRLQVNTIDRLMRSVIGPQIATDAAASTADGDQASRSSPVAAALLRQRCRGEGRDRAWEGLIADAAAVEMTDLPSEEENTKSRCDGASVMVPASSWPLRDQEGVHVPAKTPSFPSSALDADDSTVNRSRENAQQSGVAASGEVTANSKVVERVNPCLCETDEPAWAAVARAALGAFDINEKDVVVNDKTRQASPDPVAAALADVKKVAATSSADLSQGLHDLSHELYHPGRVLLLTSPWDTAHNRLVDVPRGHPVMHELFLMKYMLLQHTVDAYCGSLTVVHSQPRKEK